MQGERRPAIASAEEDDLPPPRSIVRTTRRAERERRFRERARPSGNNDGLGYDTDSELSAGDRSDLVEALTTAESDLASLFSDVKAPEFRDPNLVIRRRFEEWRQKYGEEYRMTFAGLSLAQVWEFWARVEMARWNPFEVRCAADTCTHSILVTGTDQEPYTMLSLMNCPERQRNSARINGTKPFPRMASDLTERRALPTSMKTTRKRRRTKTNRPRL